MALARVKTWIAGEILYATDLNSEFNNVLNNALSLISPLTASLNAGGFKITNYGGTDAPSDSTDVPNLVYYSASSGSSKVGYIDAGSGATARTVQAKLRDIVSAKDFGATGDGSTDDAAAIQAGLDALNTRGGGTLWLPGDNDFNIGTTTLTLHSQVNLVGDGPENTTITYSGTGSAIKATDDKWITVEGFTLDGAGTSGTSVRGIHMNGVWNFRIENIKIEGITDTKGQSVRIDNGTANFGAYNWTVENVHAISGGLYLVGVDGNNQVTSGSIISTWFSKYSVTWGSSIAFVNAVAEDFTDVGFDLVAYDQISMNGCDIEGSGTTGIAFGTLGTRNFTGEGINFGGFSGSNRFTGVPLSGIMIGSVEAARRYWGALYQFSGTTASLATAATETIIASAAAGAVYEISAMGGDGSPAYRCFAHVFSDGVTPVAVNTISNNITCLISGADIQLRNDGSANTLAWRAVRLH